MQPHCRVEPLMANLNANDRMFRKGYRKPRLQVLSLGRSQAAAAVDLERARRRERDLSRKPTLGT